MLADAFENFRNFCRKIYELDPGKFLSVPGSAWQAALENTKVKLDLLTDIDMLLILEEILEEELEEVLEEEYVTLFINKQKLITNTWKIMIKIKNSHIFNSGLYGWEISQKLSVSNFESI